MNNPLRSLMVIAVIVMLTGSYATTILADDAQAKTTNPYMVIENDIVSEWHNEKMTELTRLTDVARTANAAEEGSVLIFKHSTTCPISGRAAQRIDKMLRESEEPLPAFYMVKVIESRPVSLAIADYYEVKHESPQILLLKDGKEVWNTSHDEITAEAVLEAIEEHDAKPAASRK